MKTQKEHVAVILDDMPRTLHTRLKVRAARQGLTLKATIYKALRSSTAEKPRDR
jgi:plasmid stability protein